MSERRTNHLFRGDLKLVPALCWGGHLTRKPAFNTVSSIRDMILCTSSKACQAQKHHAMPLRGSDVSDSCA
eukprot:m.229194 g.229194  ORF g.229194 m.229194 type:complete len:71 (-) comp15204_c1_seq12:112-324(-)